MTGPEHYLLAEQLAEMAEQRAHDASTNEIDARALVFATLSVAHAQLANAAATALQVPGGEDAGMYVADMEDWEAVASARPDQGNGDRP